MIGDEEDLEQLVLRKRAAWDFVGCDAVWKAESCYFGYRNARAYQK